MSIISNSNELFNHAFSLHQLGRVNVKEAITFYQQLREQFPHEPQLLTLLGSACLQLENISEGILLLEESIKIHSNQPIALSNLGNGFYKLMRFSESLIYSDRAIALDPNFAAAHSNRADALAKLTRFDEALVSSEYAITLKPDFAEAYCTRGSILSELNRFDESLLSYDQAITLKSGFFDAYNNRSTVLSELKCFEEALVSCNQAIALNPYSAEVYSNRGAVLKELKRFEEALVSCNQAIELKPDLSEAYNNKGNILKELKRFDESLVSYDCAIMLKTNFSDAYLNKSFVKLLSGNYTEGWTLYEWRWKSVQRKKIRVFDRPLWLGEAPIAGKTVLIYEEQGLGDVIQCCRYAIMLEALGAKVILEVPEPLLSLMSTLQNDITIVTTGETLPAFDFQCPIMSLPLAFKTTIDTIPVNMPYLFSDIDKQKMWKDRLGIKTKPRIGLVCSGAIIHTEDTKRSITLNLFGPLFDLPFEFHLLQKEIRPEDKVFLAEFSHVHTHQENLIDFSDTAALIDEMDLVISVDTSVAHLAGALGKPIWVLLSWVPDFRWLLDRADSPWYPSATLFRQPERGNWEQVIEDVCMRLRQNRVC
ncbi:MAG: tetratricopeptide repeat-containing glycosyltransferase family protein [Pseudomonadota bacterium]